MNQRLLVIIGLIAIPFYELIFKVFPYIVVIAPDTRAPKELIAMFFALSIGLLAVFKGNIKPFNNKFILIIPIYLLFNLWMSPHFDLFINTVECGDLYFWKPFSEILCFILMIFAIASSDDDFIPIFKIMVICGTLMSAYVIFQKFGFDQFWIQREGDQFVQVRGRLLGGNLGQSTVVSSWIIMMIPISIYLRKYYMSFIMIIAVFLTGSAMALMSMVLMALIYLIKFNKKFLIIFATLFIILICLISFKQDIRLKIVQRMDGRFEVWKNIFYDIRGGAIAGVSQDFSTTGVGFGRFPFIFPDKHKSNFKQAHNDFLEFTYDCGFCGLAIVLFGLCFMFNKFLFHGIRFPIFLSFISILFCSLGGFPFQLGAHQFYSAIFLGLLNNDSINRRI